MNRDKAIDIIARAMLWSTYERFTENGWEEELPDFTESDYEAIVKRMGDLLPLDANLRDVEDAYVFLEKQVGKEDI